MDHAISIKQPWATLLVHGLKTIEVRRWPTRRRGRVFIHTGRTPDARNEGWQKVGDSFVGSSELRGGIVGEAQLVECRAYESAQAFARDRSLHLNDPSWFHGPVMYGFVFASARPLPFHRCSGQLFFFEVNDAPATPEPAPAGLLVSVRSANEAMTALMGGADLIDIKEPRKGALGRASDAVIAEVVNKIQGRRPVSAALGELAELRNLKVPAGLAYVKCGLAGMNRRRGWEGKLLTVRERLAGQKNAPKLVTVAYADWERAGSPRWQDVVKFALRQPGEVLLIDTFDKIGPPNRKLSRRATLLDWIKPNELARLCQQCRDAEVRVALAGSLRLRQIVPVMDVRPTWFAVRGAACEANKRDGEVHVLKVRDLSTMLRWQQSPAIAAS